MKVVTHREDAMEAEHTLGWLYRVADRTCLDAIRKRKRAPYDYVADGGGAHAVHPNVAADEQLIVLQLLASLDEEAQRIAIWAFVDGLTQEEIGRELGVSRVTVNKRVQTIRDEVKKHLASSGKVGVS